MPDFMVRVDTEGYVTLEAGGGAATADEARLMARFRWLQNRVREAGDDIYGPSDHLLKRLEEIAGRFRDDELTAEEAFLETYIAQGAYEQFRATASMTKPGGTGSGGSARCWKPDCPRRLSGTP
jgi:hypothetical protein